MDFLLGTESDVGEADCSACFGEVGRCMDGSQAERSGGDFGAGCSMSLPDKGGVPSEERLAEAIRRAREGSLAGKAAGGVAGMEADAAVLCGAGEGRGPREACMEMLDYCVGTVEMTDAARTPPGGKPDEGKGEGLTREAAAYRHCSKGMEFALASCSGRGEDLEDCDDQVGVCLGEMEFHEASGYAVHTPTGEDFPEGVAEALSVCGECAGTEGEEFRDCAAGEGRGRPKIADARKEILDDEGSPFEELQEREVREFVDKGIKKAGDLFGTIGDVFDGPGSCFVCGAIYLVVSLAPELGEQGFRLLVGPTLTLLALLFPLWLTLQFARTATALDAGSAGSAWPAVFGGMVRLLVVVVLLGGFAWRAAGELEGGAGTYRQLMGGLVAPALELSASAGLALMFSAGAGAAGFLNEVESEARETISELRGGEQGPRDPIFDGVTEGIMRFVQAAHVVGRVGFARSVGFINDAVAYESITSKVVSALFGVVLGLLFVQFLIVSGIRLIDPVLRIVALAALSPLIAAAWVFPATRQTTFTGLRGLAYSALSLVVAGLLFGLALHILMGTMMAGAGVLPGEATTYADLMKLLRNEDSTVVDGDVDYVGAIVSVIAVLVAHGIISKVQEVAGQITDFSVPDGVGGQVEGQIRGLGGQASSVVVSTGVGGVKRGFGLARGLARFLR